MASKSPLRLLGDIITSSIDRIESTLASSNLEFPSLNDPYDPTKPVEAALVTPDVLAATSNIIAAASQLIATVRHPANTIIDDALSFHLSSCIRVALESHMVEIVREAGPQGIHARDIAKKSNTDPLKVARILRLLSNHHVFKEVTPDVFASNRISSIIDSGKTLKEIEADPINKHMGTFGVAAFAETSADEVLKGSAYMTEAFLDQKTAHSVQPTETPWNIAFKTDKPLFVWYDEKDNEYRQKRFSMALAGTTKMEPPDAILTGFDWNSLPKGGIVVDVGGGVGSSSLIIAKAAPNLKFVVQDRATVLQDAEVYWKEHYPEAFSNGQLKLQVHDFFTEQPVKDASAFLLRFITHDWADPFALDILKKLRQAATPDTKLITVDVIVPYTCNASITDEIPGAAGPPIPEPLLPSLGAVNNMKYWLDLQMYIFCNSQDRTLGHFVQLAADAGWKVIQVHHIPGSALSQYVSVPI